MDACLVAVGARPNQHHGLAVLLNFCTVCAACIIDALCPVSLQIIGGSFISTGQLASKYARYQFRPHFFQHATFRLVQSSPDLSLYDTAAASPEAPILPFFETSCMDAAEPYVGDHSCCSKTRRER